MARLSPVQRLDLEDAVISLAGSALRLGHPKDRLPMHVRELANLSHDDLIACHRRLLAWVAEREERRTPKDA